MKRNLMATLVFSQGVRMLLGGDEIGRTQRGQQQRLLPGQRAQLVRLGAPRPATCSSSRGRRLKIFRSNPVLRRRSFFSGMLDGGRQKDVMWVREDGAEMTDEDWSDPENRVLGMLIPGRATDERDERGRRIRGDTVLLLLNGGSRSRKVTLPRFEGSGLWHEVLNTARPGHSAGGAPRGAEPRRALADAVAVRGRGALVRAFRRRLLIPPDQAPPRRTPLGLERLSEPSRCRSSRAPLDRGSRDRRPRC